MIRFRKMSWLGVGVVALIGSLTGSAHAASPARADEAAIRAQTTSWGKAYNGGDAKGVAALYAEDALLLAPGASGVTGRAAILEFFTRDIAGAKAAGAVFVLHPKTDVGVSGNMGWESGTYKVTVNGAVVETGKFLSVSRKKNGKWLYIRDTWNADAPPAAKQADRGEPHGSPLLVRYELTRLRWGNYRKLTRASCTSSLPIEMRTFTFLQCPCC